MTGTVSREQIAAWKTWDSNTTPDAETFRILLATAEAYHSLDADLRALREQWRRGDTMVSRDHAAVLGQVLDRHALKDDS